MSSRALFLADEVTNAFRVVIAGALVGAVVLVCTVTWYVAVAIPAAANNSHAVSLGNDMHTAMVDEVNALRAYIITGDKTVLPAYLKARAELKLDEDELSRVGGVSGSQVADLRAADTAWQEDWVARAVEPAARDSLLVGGGGNGIDPTKLDAFIVSGRPGYLAISAAQQVLLAGALHRQSSERRVDEVVISSAASVLLILGAAVGVVAVRRRRHLQARIVGPVHDLLEKMQAVGRGEFTTPPPMDAPAELLELRDELVDMSGSLRLQQQALARRAEDAAASAHRLKLVLAFAREVSDSLTLAPTLAVVATAARRFADSPRARVWLVDEAAAKDRPAKGDGIKTSAAKIASAKSYGRILRLRHDSITGDHVPDTTQPLGHGGLGQAAQTHRICVCDGLAGESESAETRTAVLAVPMVKGPRLVGVVEIMLLPGNSDPTPELLEMLEAMAAQAATSIDAALMYEVTESLSLSDALTGLANRRQLDQDLTLEIERASRYHRSLSFLMIDIDHFKAVNDTFGHAVGDAVLVEVAAVLGEQMRIGDSIYRYGGEEFAVLARESDATGAASVAERLRRVVEDRYATQAEGDVAVTISIGVSELSESCQTPGQIIAAADVALYAAKHGGRNRVEVAGPQSVPPIIPRVRIPT